MSEVEQSGVKRHEQPPQRIAKKEPATVRYVDPATGEERYYRANLHIDAFEKFYNSEPGIKELYQNELGFMSKLERDGHMGFMTEDGNFVNREEAQHIASEANQISDIRPKGRRLLNAEDLK